MTFGFEIEGRFLSSFISKLPTGWKRKYDGSVGLRDSELARLDYKVSDYSELNSPVFNNYQKMLKALSEFKFDRNWIANDSCGIHIHLGFKTDKITKTKLSDFNIISDLQEYAKENLCDHTKNRIKGNHFCRPYNIKKFDFSYNDFKNRSKYLFMGNHPSGTFEFRFFSACEHKDQNAKQFIAYLNKRLKDYKFHLGSRCYLDNKSKNFKITEKVNLSQKRLDGSYYIDKETKKRLVLSYNLLSKTENIKVFNDNDDFSYYNPFSNYIFDANPQNFNLELKKILKILKKNKIISLTAPITCQGYHNDCECGRCLEISNGSGNCGQQHCQECENYCDYAHCEDCGSESFCEEEGCEYCQEVNSREYDEMFNNN